MAKAVNPLTLATPDLNKAMPTSEILLAQEAANRKQAPSYRQNNLSSEIGRLKQSIYDPNFELAANEITKLYESYLDGTTVLEDGTTVDNYQLASLQPQSITDNKILRDATTNYQQNLTSVLRQANSIFSATNTDFNVVNEIFQQITSVSDGEYNNTYNQSLYDDFNKRRNNATGQIVLDDNGQIKFEVFNPDAPEGQQQQYLSYAELYRFDNTKLIKSRNFNDARDKLSYITTVVSESDLKGGDRVTEKNEIFSDEDNFPILSDFYVADPSRVDAEGNAISGYDFSGDLTNFSFNPSGYFSFDNYIRKPSTKLSNGSDIDQDIKTYLAVHAKGLLDSGELINPAMNSEAWKKLGTGTTLGEEILFLTNNMINDEYELVKRNLGVKTYDEYQAIKVSETISEQKGPGPGTTGAYGNRDSSWFFDNMTADTQSVGGNEVTSIYNTAVTKKTIDTGYKSEKYYYNIGGSFGLVPGSNDIGAINNVPFSAQQMTILAFDDSGNPLTPQQEDQLLTNNQNVTYKAVLGGTINTKESRPLKFGIAEMTDSVASDSYNGFMVFTEGDVDSFSKENKADALALLKLVQNPDFAKNRKEFLQKTNFRMGGIIPVSLGIK